MKRCNVIVVFNKEKDKLLFCKRNKPPYQGLYNLVGGKLYDKEDSFIGAYRELYEETGISKNDITLHVVMYFEYPIEGVRLETFVGQLNKDFQVYGEENPLIWLDCHEDFFDMNKYAGEGNIGHILEIIKEYQNEIFNNN